MTAQPTTADARQAARLVANPDLAEMTTAQLRDELARLEAEAKPAYRTFTARRPSDEAKAQFARKVAITVLLRG